MRKPEVNPESYAVFNLGHRHLVSLCLSFPSEKWCSQSPRCLPECVAVNIPWDGGEPKVLPSVRLHVHN